MPTYAWLGIFGADFDRLTPTQQAQFLLSVRQFVDDLDSGRGFRKGLRLKAMQGARGIFEMTWADDGRATFEYGQGPGGGGPYIIWRRIGTHSVFGKH